MANVTKVNDDGSVTTTDGVDAAEQESKVVSSAKKSAPKDSPKAESK